MIVILGMVVGITDCMTGRGKIVNRGAVKADTRMYLEYLVVMLDVEVCICFALIVVRKMIDGMIEYESI